MAEKLLYVFYQDNLDAPTIHEYIESIERLDELVAVQQAAKANEIKTLTNDEQLMIETDKHLLMLEELEKELSAGEYNK